MSLENRKDIQLIMREQGEVFRERLKKVFPTLMREHPIENYLSELQKRDYYRHYEIFTPALNKMLESIKENYGQEALALFHKYGLSRLIVDFTNRTDDRNILQTLWPIYASWFDRVNSDFSSQPDFYYDHKKPFWPLRKDLCVCSGRAIPIGAALVVETRLIPRKRMIKRCRHLSEGNEKHTDGPLASKHLKLAHRTFVVDKIAQGILNQAKRILWKYDLCFVLHTVERDIADFNEEQTNLAYRNIAELLKRHKRIWGIFRTSWFLDPALHRLSPHLKYLTEVPQANGAEVYRGNPCSEDEVRKAIMMSPLRSKMYREGSYNPHNYFYFWPRQAFLKGQYRK